MFVLHTCHPTVLNAPDLRSLLLTVHPRALPLCFGEPWRVDQLPRTLSGWFVLVDDKAPEGSIGALWSERVTPDQFGGCRMD